MSLNPFETPSIQEDSITSLSKKLLAVTEQLTAANQQLQKVQKERSDMLANLSHDLRAPVTAIRGAVDYLLEDPHMSEEERVNVLQMIDRRTGVLQDLIRDMYELFCVESSERPLHPETIEAASFLEEYFYSTVLDSRYETHDMHLSLEESQLGNLSVDVDKLIRLLDNLMTNAAKYSDPASPITLKAEKAGQTLKISVADEGMGIPPEALDKIFSRTYTVSTARTPGSPTGSGLGLSIARAIAEKHGGSLTCESTVGKGSTFTLTLPLV